MSDAPDDSDGADAGFERELSNARALLAGDDPSAVHVGVVRGDEVETAVARGGDDEEGRLRALTLLAAHLRTVAAEAGVDPGTLAADAARLASEMEAPGGADVPDDAGDGPATDDPGRSDPGDDA